MPFITQGKTNWKYILIIVILAVIVGGGILWFLQQKIPSYQLLEIKIPEKVKDETADWKTYISPEGDFTFKYPKDWEIINDYIYETAAGIKSEYRTVELRKIGNESSNDWIRLNPRQFQSEFGTCTGGWCT